MNIYTLKNNDLSILFSILHQFNDPSNHPRKQMEDINVKSIRYPVSVDQKLEKISNKLGRTKRQLFIQIVDYFYKSKKDPADLNDELLKNTLMKNHQQYIAFIRTQENMLLIPMKAEIDRMSKSQQQIIDRFNTEVLKHNVTVLKGQQTHTNAFAEIGNALEIILSALKDKDQLKEQFLLIMENYISARDKLGTKIEVKEKEFLWTLAQEKLRSL